MTAARSVHSPWSVAHNPSPGEASTPSTVTLHHEGRAALGRSDGKRKQQGKGKQDPNEPSSARDGCGFMEDPPEVRIELAVAVPPDRGGSRAE